MGAEAALVLLPAKPGFLASLGTTARAIGMTRRTLEMTKTYWNDREIIDVQTKLRSTRK
jgi:hypothetical protein